MRDLVARARAASYDERLSDGMLYRQLADEIERLTRERDAARAEVARLTDLVAQYAEVAAVLNAQRAADTALLREVQASGVECDLPGVDYVTVQIDRDVWARLAARLREGTGR